MARSRAWRSTAEKPATSARARIALELRPTRGTASPIVSTMMNSVTMSSRSVKPRLAPLHIPRDDVRILSFAARRLVGALRPDVVITMLAGAAPVLVCLAPRIARHRLLQIRAVPVGDVGIPLQRLQSLRGVRIGAHVEPVLIEGGTEELDLGLGRRLLGFGDVLEEPRTDEADQEAEHDDDDEQLDQREARLAERAALSERAARARIEPQVACSRRGLHRPHSGISLIEKMAS